MCEAFGNAWGLIKSLWVFYLAAFARGAPSYHVDSKPTLTPRQDFVTYDKQSLIVHGERVLLLSGEFHPFRLPSPGLWLDIFQKIRAIGFTCVSFYVDWALLEGEQGRFHMKGVFALEKFFDAAMEAGIHLIARPGPYINAETSGGGFPGWLSRLRGKLRTSDQDYLGAITPYMRTIGEVIAKAQIHRGGPVILFQPENEYTLCYDGPTYTQVNNYTLNTPGISCLDKSYMAYIQEVYRNAGIEVPLIVNDAYPVGGFAPNTGTGATDIYSFDYYPLGLEPGDMLLGLDICGHFNCPFILTAITASDPSDWSSLRNPLLAYNITTHEQMSGDTPFSISEYQGGTTDGWCVNTVLSVLRTVDQAENRRGEVGADAQAALINHEFARVFYKLNYGMHIAIQNLYMVDYTSVTLPTRHDTLTVRMQMFGGTNWGNLGHPGGYTSYDFGAAIAENRLVVREVYSELKLQANFLLASPVYLTMTPENATLGVYTDRTDLQVIRLSDGFTAFYVVHHHDLASRASSNYTLQFGTSLGNLTIPQMGGTLALSGRDAKIHVVDYDLDGIKLIYSTAEIFTWKYAANRTILILYGDESETHEFAVLASLGRPVHMEGGRPKVKQIGPSNVVQWKVNQSRGVIAFGRLEIHLVSRNAAYNYWVIGLPGTANPIPCAPGDHRL